MGPTVRMTEQLAVRLRPLTSVAQRPSGDHASCLKHPLLPLVAATGAAMALISWVMDGRTDKTVSTAALFIGLTGLRSKVSRRPTVFVLRRSWVPALRVVFRTPVRHAPGVAPARSIPKRRDQACYFRYTWCSKQVAEEFCWNEQAPSGPFNLPRCTSTSRYRWILALVVIEPTSRRPAKNS
jgi:hypothetical protein